MKKLLILGAFVLLASPMAFAETKAGTHGEFGNHCAMGLTMGKQVTTDCSINWTDSKTHKTYCFSSEAMKNEWAKNTEANEKKASEQFAKLGSHSSTH